jgi:cell wall-associated NlpC family hydrolase
LAVQTLQQIASGTFTPQNQLAAIAQARAEARAWGGTLEPPRNRGGGRPQAGNAVIDKILSSAHSVIGKPYVWGGESLEEGGFDCSGLLDWAFRQAGIDLPGRLTSQSALGMGRSVKGKKLRPGDFIITNGGRHIVLFVGGNRVIASPHSGSVVQYQPLERFRGDIVDVRRVL